MPELEWARDGHSSVKPSQDAMPELEWAMDGRSSVKPSQDAMPELEWARDGRSSVKPSQDAMPELEWAMDGHSSVKIEAKLVGVRAEPHRGDFAFTLPLEPGGDDVIGKDIATEKEVGIGREGVACLSQ